MNNFVLKFCGLAIVSIGILVGVTNANMNDVEGLKGNTFAATSLDLELRDELETPYSGMLFEEDRVMREDNVEKNVFFASAGVLGFEYFLEFEQTHGDSLVCEEMEIVVLKNGEDVYNGELSELDTATNAAKLSNSGVDEWKFSLSHENENVNLQGKECGFDIVAKAFENVSTQAGFSDVERLSGNVEIGYQAKLSAEYNVDEFNFSVSDLDYFQSFTYTLHYLKDGGEELVLGVEDIDENVSNVEVYLGTCSDACTPYLTPHDFNLQLNLLDIDGYISTLSAEL